MNAAVPQINIFQKQYQQHFSVVHDQTHSIKMNLIVAAFILVFDKLHS